VATSGNCRISTTLTDVTHSPPLAALIARASETDVLLTQVGEWLTISRIPRPLGRGSLFSGSLADCVMPVVCRATMGT
jgi:hypothetical protein